MSLLYVPVEIRLRILSELLVQDDTVEFGADFGPRNPPLNRVDRKSLNPAILRVSKTVNREAIPLLYSSNRFRFPDAIISFDYSGVPYIAPFLRQIGLNARYLRHIFINFLRPIHSHNLNKPALREEHIHVLQHIQETCLGLKVIEMSCMPPDNGFPLYDVDLAADMLQALDNGGVKDISSLEKFIVVCGEYDIDEEVMVLRDNLMQRMPSSKWSIELIKVPPRRWISDNDMVEFDNEEDCCRYNKEMDRLDMEREEREEQEREEAEYWRRRHDPYWKNDSDYD